MHARTVAGRFMLTFGRTVETTPGPPAADNRWISTGIDADMENHTDRIEDNFGPLFPHLGTAGSRATRCTIELRTTSSLETPGAADAILRYPEAPIV